MEKQKNGEKQKNEKQNRKIEKYYLFTPGPTEIPPRVLRALASPIIHHRSKDFRDAFFDVKDKLKKLFFTSNDVVIFASSGTGAMEAAVSNFFRKGDRVLVINGGKFGERWSKICKAFGLEVEEIKVEWGKAVEPEEVERKLSKEIAGVFIQACETSTGVEHPVKQIAQIIKDKNPDALFVVDGITAVGVWDVRMDEWGIDVLVAGSQKALMLPPGLSFISASEKALERSKKSDLPKFYFDIKRELKAQAEGETAFTPAISLIMALREALNMMWEEGLENVFERHRKLAKLLRKLISEMELEFFAKSPAPGLTTVVVPNAEEVRREMRKLGAWVAGGQEHLKGKIIRIAHMGYYTEGDMIFVAGVLKEALARVASRS